MNKKINYLSIIPLYGTCIALIYLFFLSVKEKISKRIFMKVFWICAIVSALCWSMTYLILFTINRSFHISFLMDNLIIILIVIAGYMMNAFVFTFINKKWAYLTTDNENKKTRWLEVNKKQLLFIALVLSIVITILGFVLLALYGII